jgi:uncharacterized protein (DUF2062 family)
MTQRRAIARMSDWLARRMPSRAHLERNRLTRPLAARTDLFRLTRRSVPRGVAIGLLVGIFAMIPGVQVVGAALLCVPFRGNIPLAAGMTLLSNPATTPFILAGSLYIGSGLGFHADVASLYGLYRGDAGLAEWTRWLLSDAAPALALGLFAIAATAGAAGYLIASFAWRGIVFRKRRRRLAHGASLSPAE